MDDMKEPITGVLCDLIRRSFKIKDSTDRSRKVWAIITALRGPDCNNGELKELTTGRLRAVIGLDPSASGLTITYGKLNEVQREVRDRLLRTEPFHFANHWEMAVSAVRFIYGYDLENEREFPPKDKPYTASDVAAATGRYFLDRAATRTHIDQLNAYRFAWDDKPRR